MENKKKYLNENQVIIDSLAINQNEVFSEIANIAKENKIINDTQLIIDGLKKREQEISTGLEDGFAIPHVKLKELTEPAIIFIRLKNPIYWKTFDHSKVKIIISLLIPENSNELHIQTLAAISTKLLDQHTRALLKKTKDKKIIINILNKNDEKVSQSSEDSTTNGYIIGVTSCPAGVAHTYMAAKAIEDYAKKMHYAVKVEKQGANGIENRLTDYDIKNANALIIASDLQIAEYQRFANIPTLKVSVGEPIHNMKNVFDQALEISLKKRFVSLAINEQTVITKNKKGWFKLKFKTGAKNLKNSILTGVSYVVPLIVAGTTIVALIAIISQIAGVNYIKTHANWLNTLSDVSGKTLSILLAPVLSAYIAYAMADKPGLAPGFLGGLACVYVSKTADDGVTVIVDGLGFLGGLIIGIFTGYMIKFFKKYLVSKKMQGVLTWFVYPVLGSIISVCLILFAIGQPIALLINEIFSGLAKLQTSKGAAALGIVIGLMCVFDLGGPFNKVAWAFSFASFSQAFTESSLTNPLLLVPYTAFWAAGIGTGWTTTIVTLIGKKMTNEYEKDAGKMSWILSSLGITEGSIPLALSDPFRVIPSFMAGGAVAGGLSAGFSLGSTITGGGFITMAGIQSATGTYSIGIAILLWFMFALIGTLVSTSLLLALKFLKTKPQLEQKVKKISLCIITFGILAIVNKYYPHKEKNITELNSDQSDDHKIETD